MKPGTVGSYTYIGSRYANQGMFLDVTTQPDPSDGAGLMNCDPADLCVGGNSVQSLIKARKSGAGKIRMVSI